MFIVTFYCYDCSVTVHGPYLLLSGWMSECLGECLSQLKFFVIQLITLNVNGLSTPFKRSKVIPKKKSEKAQIIIWQQTHLTDQEHEEIKKRVLNMLTIYPLKQDARGAWVF